MVKVDILGLQINTEPKRQIVAELEQRTAAHLKTFVVTPYSEFFYYSAKDYRFRQLLNNADFALPDGTALQWLGEYFKKPLTAKKYYPKVLQAFWQEFTTGLEIIFKKNSATWLLPERISGADFFWDILESASKHNRSVFLLGGFGDTAAVVIQKALKKYPNLRIGFSAANPNDQIGIEAINAFSADYLLVAYGPVRQEFWIADNLPRLKATVAIGLGGTFDYVAGKKSRPPKFIRSLGFEWLYRLITQPYRMVRIWHATFSLMLGAARQKVFETLEYRKNAVGVIINNQKEVLIVCRNRETSNATKDLHWQFPQGGIECGESPEQGIIREMHEELGTDKFEVLGECSKTYAYDWYHFFRPLLWDTREYRGQKQHIFYLRFTGEDSDFHLDEREIISPKWVKPNELAKYLHPMRQEMLQVAMIDLQQYLDRI
jgi:N-acetylglucosaminyldiphosphoundecaprenol N-acetyl-beta-D-mannosaminyltransferase